MFKHQKVEPYDVSITEGQLQRWQGVVRVWDTPQSAIEGGKVVDQITAPTKAQVLEEQMDVYGSIPQRARIAYGEGKEGWVIYDMIEKGAGRASS